MSEADPALRRVELTSLAACAAMACLALATFGAAAAAAVFAGGLLIAVSYISMKSGIGALFTTISPAPPGIANVRSRRQTGGIALKIAGRYALLALLAYVMIARLRLHPVGLMAGVSSVVAAASIEAIRLQLQKKP